MHTANGGKYSPETSPESSSTPSKTYTAHGSSTHDTSSHSCGRGRSRRSRKERVNEGGTGIAGRQLVLTASQVESLLDDTEFVFSGSDDDLDAELDEDDRQQGDLVVVVVAHP